MEFISHSERDEARIKSPQSHAKTNTGQAVAAQQLKLKIQEEGAETFPGAVPSYCTVLGQHVFARILTDFGKSLT